MRSILFIAAVAALLAVAQAQAPIPYRADGFQIGAPLGAPIQFDAFVDVLCPDCAAAWPNIQAVTAYYASNISTTIHTFPLPYHTLGFQAAQAVHVVLDQPELSFEPASLFTEFFQGQQQFWNPSTVNQTGAEIAANMQQFIVGNGFASAEVFAAGMADDNINEETRVSWKYACSRGVLGTPTFFVNGVNVNGDPSWTLADWRQILDPLLAPKPQARKIAAAKPKCVERTMFERKFSISVTDCPAGEPACAYLPGKTECCLPGEMCIPNVGCRC